MRPFFKFLLAKQAARCLLEARVFSYCSVICWQRTGSPCACSCSGLSMYLSHISGVGCECTLSHSRKCFWRGEKIPSVCCDKIFLPRWIYVSATTDGNYLKDNQICRCLSMHLQLCTALRSVHNLKANGKCGEMRFGLSTKGRNGHSPQFVEPASQ